MTATLTLTPCARCGTAGGYGRPGRRPKRYAGERFGVAGVVCNACYKRLHGARVGPAADLPDGRIARRVALAHAIRRRVVERTSIWSARAEVRAQERGAAP